MNRKLMRQQIQNRMNSFANPELRQPPPAGWIHSIRRSLGMSLEQLGTRLGITRQSALDIERRERTGMVTLNALRKAADALDMHLVYGFVPKDGSLEKLIERRAYELARTIVLRTSVSMELEDQKNSDERIQEAIRERTEQLKSEVPKQLWD